MMFYNTFAKIFFFAALIGLSIAAALPNQDAPAYEETSLAELETRGGMFAWWPSRGNQLDTRITSQLAVAGVDAEAIWDDQPWNPLVGSFSLEFRAMHSYEPSINAMRGRVHIRNNGSRRRTIRIYSVFRNNPGLVAYGDTHIDPHSTTPFFNFAYDANKEYYIELRD